LQRARLGGATGSVAVNWEIIAASGSSADVTAAEGTLSWADGDASEKTIDLGIHNDGVTEDIERNDGVTEDIERLVIKLTAPDGGATLASPNLASVYISDPGSISTAEFDREEVTIAERGFATAVAVIRRRGSAAGTLTVQYSVTGGDATAGTDYSGPANGTLIWADGDADPKWIEYAILDDGSGENSEYIELTLNDAAGGTIGGNGVLRINVSDGTGP
jgi:hypothetical protein